MRRGHLGLFRILEGSGLLSLTTLLESWRPKAVERSLVVSVTIPGKCPSLNVLLSGRLRERIAAKMDLREHMKSQLRHTDPETEIQIMLFPKSS